MSVSIQPEIDLFGTLDVLCATEPSPEQAGEQIACLGVALFRQGMELLEGSVEVSQENSLPGSFEVVGDESVAALIGHFT